MSTHRTNLVLILGWLLIAAKCGLVIWAVQRWQMPLHAGWLVWPTLACGALATWLWLAHRRRLPVGS